MSALMQGAGTIKAMEAEMTVDEKNESTSPAPAVSHGSGSVAHQIIGEFLAALEAEEGYAEIAKALRPAFFDGKVTEIGLRLAMFGEDVL